jgi:serine/threonine-protein kinase
MTEHATLIRPAAETPEPRGISSAFPPDLQEQIRRRVRVLALLMFIAFSFDPTLYFLTRLANRSTWQVLPPELTAALPFQFMDLGAVAASAALWWAAGNRRVSASLLFHLGLVYEVAICFVIAFVSFWSFYTVKGYLPSLTWVPSVVIFFPLVLPGPPRRILAASVAAAAMTPLSLAILDILNKIPAEPDAYFEAFISSGFAVLFAYMGARIVYGLGRQVAAAREMGSYQLEKRLGQGGMGEVWQARHRMLARPAAIKLIAPSLTSKDPSGDVVRRFEREAQVTAGLRSPHTVELFDFGVSDDGTFYYVMELLDGIDTDTLVRKSGPLPAERAIFVLRQVCHSLAEAEARGLVHRDIKPANIFLCRYGEDYDFVKVLDFGIVKAMHDAAETAPALTVQNVVHGTPAFMAPEQAIGRALDGRADIYSTGCVAYWLLTGQLVFSGDTPMALLMHHAQTLPAAPSARSEVPIPEALDRLILSCLAKDPADRPQSANELSRRLGAIEPANAWTDARAREWWATHQPVRA